MNRVLSSFLAVCAICSADVRLPALISDHMMLQRDVAPRVWGWAEAGELVKVTFKGATLSTTADGSGRWQVFLKPSPMQAAGSNLTVAGKNTVVVRDVLVGDVWVASGQSNMEWPMAKTDNAEKEIAQANYPSIRMFLVKKTVAEQPLDDVTGNWVLCTPDSVKGQSAVAYFFARELWKTQSVPQGLLNSYWGGTPAQAWTTLATLQEEPNFRFILDNWQSTVTKYPEAKKKFDEDSVKWKETQQGRAPAAPQGPGHPHSPAGLYNGMIAPLTPYAIKGAIWYQGESNGNEAHAYVYRKLFRSMIEDWRHRWGVGDFPFYFVQLANFNASGWWPVLRESQSETISLRNTGMAVTTDIGNPTDIHPTNKQDVGHRLALLARAQTYGEKIVSSGPVYRTMTLDGGSARVWFDSVGKGLVAKGGGRLTGFEIAGPDGTFVPAEATVDGATVLLSNAAVKAPASVRYDWQDNPTANLFNADGLPASPFRNQPRKER